MEAAEWGLAGGRFGDALRAGAGAPAAGRAAQYLAAVKMLQARPARRAARRGCRRAAWAGVGRGAGC